MPKRSPAEVDPLKLDIVNLPEPCRVHRIPATRLAIKMSNDVTENSLREDRRMHSVWYVFSSEASLNLAVRKQVNSHSIDSQ